MGRYKTWLYAGNSEYPAVLVHVSHPLRRVTAMSSENPSGADNQQETAQLDSIRLGRGLRRWRRLLQLSRYYRNRSMSTRLASPTRVCTSYQRRASSRTCSKSMVEFFGCGRVCVEPPTRQPSRGSRHATRSTRFGDLRDVDRSVLRSNTRCERRSETTSPSSPRSCELMRAPTSTSRCRVSSEIARDRPDDELVGKPIRRVSENPQRLYAEPSSSTRCEE